jgi:hypothetical protein
MGRMRNPDVEVAEFGFRGKQEKPVGGSLFRQPAEKIRIYGVTQGIMAVYLQIK